MHSFVLQDWVTISGDGTSGGGVTTITQAAAEYLDLEGYQDVTIWWQVGSVSGGTVEIHFQTAPEKYEANFKDLTNFSYSHGSTGVQALSATIGNTVNPGTALTPLARWLRWSLQQTAGGAVVWSMTFRILVCGLTYQ
jgi:hypothetical protein